MPNSKYDHTNVIMDGEDWAQGRILAYLYEGAVFDKGHKFLSEVREGAMQRGVTEVQNRSIGENGEAYGLPAMFNATAQGGPFQAVLAWDLNQDEMQVIAFYDEDEDGGDLALQNNGTFILRPEDYDQAAGRGVWFSF